VGVCGGQIGTGTVFSPSTSFFPLSVLFLECSILIFIYTLLLPEGQTGEAWEASKKQCSFERWIEKFFYSI
jgi:hypothetical protein